MARLLRRSLLLAGIFCCAGAVTWTCPCRGAAQESSAASRLWSVGLSGDVTGACFLTQPSGQVSYFVCAGDKLTALNAEGRLQQGFRSGAEDVERLIPLKSSRLEAAPLLAYKNWGNEIILLNRQGQQVGKKFTGGDSIDWVAADDRHVLVGFNGDAGLRLFDRTQEASKFELTEVWARRGFHNCWNVALGDFGGYGAATSENDGLAHFSIDGKRMLRQKFGDITSLEAVPESSSKSILVAINDLNSGREEIIGVRLDRVPFRVPIGRNKFTSSVSWRLRRIVPGRFIGTLPQFAVLRGDGSIVAFDLNGRPLSLLPSNRSRAAIELGPPHQGRDTLLACEGKSLSRLLFPAITQEVAAARAAIDNPNKELLRISERDTSDDLWARALWLSISDTAPTGEEIASLFKAALNRATHKAPIYVSYGDVVSGSNSWMNVLGGALETMATSLGKALASHAKDTQNEHPKADKGLDPKQVGEIYKNSMVDAGTQIVSDLNRAEKEEGFRAIVLYRAAVAEDPNNKAAWFRLAYFAHGELRAHAIAESIRLDPQNAFPYYVRAIAEVQQGKLAAARDSVRAGNERPFFSAYEIPLPETVRLNFPDHEWLRDLGLVGRPIPRSAFVYFVRLHTSVFTQIQPFSHNDLAPRLRGVALKFFGEAERLQKLGKTNEVTAWLEILNAMGIQLMRIEPRDSNVCLTGMAVASGACIELKSAYQALGDKDKLQRTEASAKRLKQWIDEYSAARYPRGVKAEDEDTIMREAARGSRDFLKEEQQVLETTLRHSGLIAGPKSSAR